MKSIRKNKSAVEFLTPVQKRNRKLKHIKHDSNIKSQLVKFEEILADKNIFSAKYANAKSYPVGQIWPVHYLNKTYTRADPGYKYDEFRLDVYVPEHRLILKPNKKYTLIIDYPLSIPYEQEIQSGKDGMTLKEVVNLVVDAYQKVYKEEAKTSKLKEESISKRTKGASNLINRAETNGKYGIWGHDLRDLCITHVIVKGSKIYLSVDS